MQTMHTQMSFPLNSEQCEMLLQLKNQGSVQKLAEFLKRDVSAVNRQLQKIASISDLLEKQQGRWRVSKHGDQMVEWAREAILSQRQILNERSEICIVTTREFAARVLAPQLPKIREENEQIHFVILTSEDGVESLLLNGRADLGLDCGRPQDPLIRYRPVQPEPFSVVATPDFISQHKISKKNGRVEMRKYLLELPYLQYLRPHQGRSLDTDDAPNDIVGSFNDLATIRSACCAGLGWAIVPSYTVRDEIRSGNLNVINCGLEPPAEKFGVWWVREHRAMQSWATRMTDWLSKQDLNVYK